MSVDLRSRHFAFRGRAGEPPRRWSACGVSPAPYSRRSLRAFRANQQSCKINNTLLLTQPNNKKLSGEIFFKPRVSTQSEYEFVSIDELVPDNHLLRLIDKYIDLSFLLEKVRPYYSDDNGRPSDPTILFKMMFIGYIYGIRSERQLQREIEMNVAYRWFLGLKFKDPVPPLND